MLLLICPHVVRYCIAFTYKGTNRVTPLGRGEGVMIEFFLRGGLPLLFSQLCAKRLLPTHMAIKIGLCLFIYSYLDCINILTSFGPSFRCAIASKLSASGVHLKPGAPPMDPIGGSARRPPLQACSPHSPMSPNQWPLPPPMCHDRLSQHSG